MSPADRQAYLRLALFTAFAAFVAVEWVSLVTDPPLARALACLPVVALGGLALIQIGTSRLGTAQRLALAALVAILTAVVALVVVGLPARLLAPGNWGELGSSVHSGLEGLEDVDYPYTGDRPWSRLVIMLVLPLALTCSAAVAFWPRSRPATRPPLLALAILVALYAAALVNDTASHPLLRGAVLFAFVAAWLWLPGLGRRQIAAMAAIVAVAGAVAVPAASALDADRPWLDHSDWDLEFSGQGEDEVFDWDHGYGPIDWPRTGRKLLEVRSRSAHYWRAAVLDSFDGIRWRSSGQLRPRPPSSRLALRPVALSRCGADGSSGSATTSSHCAAPRSSPRGRWTRCAAARLPSTRVASGSATAPSTTGIPMRCGPTYRTPMPSFCGTRPPAMRRRWRATRRSRPRFPAKPRTSASGRRSSCRCGAPGTAVWPRRSWTPLPTPGSRRWHGAGPPGRRPSSMRRRRSGIGSATTTRTARPRPGTAIRCARSCSATGSATASSSPGRWR